MQLEQTHGNRCQRLYLARCVPLRSPQSYTDQLHPHVGLHGLEYNRRQKGLSTVENLSWTKGEWAYRNYTDGYNTYPYYPHALENAGVLIIDQQLGVNEISYTGWEDEIKARSEEADKRLRDQFLRQPGQAMQTAGSLVMAGGLLAAPFTGGGSLVAVPIGNYISSFGLGLETTAEMYDGDWETVKINLAVWGISEALTFGVGSIMTPIKSSLRGPTWLGGFLEANTAVSVDLSATAVSSELGKKLEAGKQKEKEESGDVQSETEEPEEKNADK